MSFLSHRTLPQPQTNSPDEECVCITGAVVEWPLRWPVYLNIHYRSVGGRAGVCFDRSGVLGSRPSAGRSICVKPFSGAPALHS